MVVVSHQVTKYADIQLLQVPGNTNPSPKGFSSGLDSFFDARGQQTPRE